MKTIHILLIEDNEGDIVLTTEALAEWKTPNVIIVLKDGEAAIDLFETTTRKALPDLVLLDINLPKKNGHEVLRYMKGSDKIRHIPVIMLTTSSSPNDINNAYNNYANCYITKPDDVDTFLNIIAVIETFWISVVTLPNLN